MSQQVHAAVFHPDDDHIERAVELLDSLGATPVPDPIPAIKPTGATPKPGASVVLASKTGVRLLDEAGRNPGDAVLCCIGPAIADATRDASWTVDRVPDEYASAGLVNHLAPDMSGATIEVARSDHDSAVLTNGLRGAGAGVHEMVLYQLVRPKGTGGSAGLTVTGDLEAALLTSSLTVEYFLDATAEHGIREEAIAGLSDAAVGVVGSPTHNTTESHGIDMTIVPDEVTFGTLAVAAVEIAAPTYREWRSGKRSGRGDKSRNER